MSNELNINLPPGLTGVTASLYCAGALAQAGISLSEVSGAGGQYSGSMPAVAAGDYIVEFFQGGQLRGSGLISWTGTSEITPSNTLTTTALNAAVSTLAGDITASQTAIIGAMPSTAGLATTANVTGAVSTLAGDITASQTAIISAMGGGSTSISITVPPEVAAASQIPAQLPAVNFCTLRKTLPAMGNIATRTALWFTAKINASDADSAAILQITESGGLLIVNGQPATNAALGSLTVTDANAGTVNLFVDETIMALIAPTIRYKPLAWGAKFKMNEDTTEPISGQMPIFEAVTHANS